MTRSLCPVAAGRARVVRSVAFGLLAAAVAAAPSPAAAAPGGLELVRTLLWATAGAPADPARVTLEEPGPERPARGPAGVAVDASGALLVVDTLARRVVRVGAEGPPTVVFAAEDALEPVAVAALPGGGVAVLDRVRRDVTLVKDGVVSAKAALPHGLQHLAGLLPLADGRTALVTAYQESYPVPAQAAASTASWFAGRLPGVPLPDGRVATVALAGGGAITLRWLQPPPLGVEWELAEAATLSLDPPARAARIVGGTKEGALVLEVDHDEPSEGGAARFGRRLLRVLPAGLGKGTASVTLPTEGLLYVPFAGSAIAEDGSVVVLLPVAEGLQLLRWQPPARPGAAPAAGGPAPAGGVR